jgi:hypothetical protein
MGGVTGEWRKLHNEELSDLYCSQNVIPVMESRRMRLAGNVARIGGDKMRTSLWLENLDGKRPVGRHKCRQEDNIKIDLQEMGWKSVDWIDVA